jgi:hypothetical protein
MGKVKDVYLQYAEVGDQNVGRVVSGLPVLDIRFSSTTPFFKVDDGNFPAKGTCTVTDVDEFVKLVFPFTVPVAFRLVATQLSCCVALYYSELNAILLPW